MFPRCNEGVKHTDQALERLLEEYRFFSRSGTIERII
jgi:hypothetical protein